MAILYQNTTLLSIPSFRGLTPHNFIELWVFFNDTQNIGQIFLPFASSPGLIDGSKFRPCESNHRCRMSEALLRTGKASRLSSPRQTI